LTSEECVNTLNRSLVDQGDKLFSQTFAISSGNSDFYKSEQQMCEQFSKTWLLRVLAISLAKRQRELLAKMSKLSLRKDTDMHIEDCSINDIHSIIKQAVTETLKKLDKKQTSPSNSKTLSSIELNVYTNPYTRSQKSLFA
jgi:hypothetical protein